MSRNQQFRLVLWINLVIGIYNLRIFVVDYSVFHLVLGSLNIGAWALYLQEAFNINIKKSDRIPR